MLYGAYQAGSIAIQRPSNPAAAMAHSKDAVGALERWRPAQWLTALNANVKRHSPCRPCSRPNTAQKPDHAGVRSIRDCAQPARRSIGPDRQSPDAPDALPRSRHAHSWPFSFAEASASMRRGGPARRPRRGGRPRRVAPKRPVAGSSASGPTPVVQGRETPGSAAWLSPPVAPPRAFGSGERR